MGIKKRTDIKQEQKKKRKKRRLKLQKKGRDLNDYFSDGFYVAKPIK